MPSDKPRSHARLHYPMGSRPSLILEADALDVLDLSERGLRYRQHTGPVPQVGQALEGMLRLSKGETLPVRGTVVRVTRPDGPARPGVVEVAARLTDSGIPRRVIIAERQAIQSHPPRA